VTLLAQLLQPLWEISAEPVAIVSNRSGPADRRIVYINPAFTRLTGFSREAALDRPPHFMHGVGTDLAMVEQGEALIRDGQPFEHTLVQYRMDGAAYRCSVTTAPLVDADGASEFLISMFKPAVDAAIDPALTPNRPIPLTLPMPLPLHEYRNGNQPEHLKSHPELDALLTIWHEKRGARAQPRRSDFPLETMTRWASHMSVATVTPERRFRFRLFGTELAHVYGRDLTGHFLDELTPHDVWSVVIKDYREVLATEKPLFAPVSVANGRWYSEVSRLLLPLSDGARTNSIMGADYQRYNTEH
jgi:PAS domain S-box-containing protein